MNSFDLQASIDRLLFFISQMAGITLPRILVALFGLLILVIIIAGRWERRIKIVPSLLGILTGGLMVALAADTRLLHWLLDTSFLQRIRFFLGLLSVLVMAVTFESIRIARLRERYAILWMITAGMVLLAALFPQAIQFLTILLGVQYVTAVVIVVFSFLLLVIFHFSVALSGLEEDRARIAQRCALLELRMERVEATLCIAPVVEEPKHVIHLVLPSVSAGDHPRLSPRKLRGADAGALCIIIVSVLAVWFVGLKTSEPLIGDEVTHYFLLKNQAKMWPTPTFFAEIPNAWSDHPEVRRYPHPNGWHYAGAIVDRMFGGHFFAIQIYQGLFWLQLLASGYLWSRMRGGSTNRSSMLYIIVLASVPMNLLFSVSFYQDVPMAAQAVTAFYLLDRRRYVWSALFMGLAIWMKVTGVIFVLPHLLVAASHLRKEYRAGLLSRGRALLYGLLIILAIGSFAYFNKHTLHVYAGAPYYPTQQLERIFKNVRDGWQSRLNHAEFIKADAIPSSNEIAARVRPVTSYEAEIIANHPGDLRNPINFILYGGVVIWVVMAGAVVGLIRPRSDKIQVGASRRQSWPLLVGLFYALVTYLQLRTAPDARFFLPAIPFIALPLCEWCMRLPWTRWVLVSAAVMGILQGTYVLKTTAELRRISPATKAAIDYLRVNPPSPNRIFMYPEGNYRLFSSPHEWYLSYRLREFWKGDNDERIELLRRHRIGAVVIKKHLIAPVDDMITDLGVYPTYFVDEVIKDMRFEKVFENESAFIFLVPGKESE